MRIIIKPSKCTGLARFETPNYQEKTTNKLKVSWPQSQTYKLSYQTPKTTKCKKEPDTIRMKNQTQELIEFFAWLKLHTFKAP
jgi:hypothetical protein